MRQATSTRKRTTSKGRKVKNEGGPARRGAGDHWLDSFIPYRLYRATAKLNGKLLTRLRSLRINPSRWRVLSVLKAYGPLSIGEIAEATLTEQPNVSRVVTQLEKEGRVLRRSSAKDSRSVHISLTQQGIDAFNQIAATALKHEELAFRDINDKDIAALLAILDQIEKNMQAPE